MAQIKYLEEAKLNQNKSPNILQDQFISVEKGMLPLSSIFEQYKWHLWVVEEWVFSYIFLLLLCLTDCLVGLTTQQSYANKELLAKSGLWATPQHILP